ncbi:uncharacterized protein LOC113384404 [Ctenocephalides felis]|uniref:uncharacterized protein LOC113384404 n=1 Tax=Ctenocephalides felis TaxID=7515 RepID=UPI000E6E3738|nr:uncharacterized protein LOC113384404 [Ctenocephalides felis]
MKHSFVLLHFNQFYRVEVLYQLYKLIFAMAKLRKEKASKETLSNSGSTSSFHEEQRISPVVQKKLRGRTIAATSKVIKRKPKKAKANAKNLKNRTYSLSPVKIEQCANETILQTPIASSTCIKDIAFTFCDSIVDENTEVIIKAEKKNTTFDKENDILSDEPTKETCQDECSIKDHIKAPSVESNISDTNSDGKTFNEEKTALKVKDNNGGRNKTSVLKSNLTNIPKKQSANKQIAYSSIPLPKFNLQKHVVKKNLATNSKLQSCSSKVAFGSVEIIPKSNLNDISSTSTDSLENFVNEFSTPPYTAKDKTIGCTPRMRANSILGLSDSNEKVSEKNISYVKPCVIKPPEVTDRENETSIQKKEPTRIPQKKTITSGIRRELRKSASQPLLTPKAKIDKPKPFVKTISFADQSGNDTKYVSRLKMPNFALIHNKNFNKMESVDEYAKRKEARAKDLMTPKSERRIATKIKKTPVANTKLENKTVFDFRGIKKNEAISRHEKHVDMAKKILKKPVDFSTKRQQMLKGVRLNKRFDLQLQFRQGI